VAASEAYLKPNIMECPYLSLSQPWDIDVDGTCVACVANLSVATANNTILLEDTGIDEIAFDQKTNQCGMKYTTKQFTEAKLLKSLHDAAAPYFLY
jgi:hypothetical protein